jgi:hypothetical protein
VLGFGGFYKQKLEYSLAISWKRQVVAVAQVISEVKTLQNSTCIPKKT